MSYSAQKYEALRRLGVQQLPDLFEPAQYGHDEPQHGGERRDSSPRNSYDSNEPRMSFETHLAIRGRPVCSFHSYNPSFTH